MNRRTKIVIGTAAAAVIAGVAAAGVASAADSGGGGAENDLPAAVHDGLLAERMVGRCRDVPRAC